MKIIFIDLDDIKNPLLGAGQAHATWEVGKRLAKKGHHVTVVCSSYPNCINRVQDGINYVHIGFSTSNIKLNNLIYIFTLPFIVKKLNGDVIIECFTAPISTLFTPLFTKIPVVAMPSMFNAKEFEKKYHIPFTIIEKIGLKLYKYIMPYSNIDKAKALRLNPKISYKIIPQGVSNTYFNIRRKKGKYILFLGRFDIAQKGIDILIDAYALISNKISFPLVIAGHGPDKIRLVEKINKLNLTSKVKIVGPAYDKYKYNLMSYALFTAFPSRHDEMCLWTLESLAAGLPIVGFNIPESDWLNSKVALLTKPFDIYLYSKALLKLTDYSLNKKMSSDSKVFAKLFTWDKTVNKIESYLKHIVSIEAL